MLALLRMSLARVSQLAPAQAVPRLTKAPSLISARRLMSTNITPPETPKPTKSGFGRILASLVFVGTAVPIGGVLAYAHVPSFAAAVDNTIPPAYTQQLQDVVALIQGVFHKQADPLPPAHEPPRRLLDSEVPTKKEASSDHPVVQEQEAVQPRNEPPVEHVDANLPESSGTPQEASGVPDAVESVEVATENSEQSPAVPATETQSISAEPIIVVDSTLQTEESVDTAEQKLADVTDTETEVASQQSVVKVEDIEVGASQETRDESDLALGSNLLGTELNIQNTQDVTATDAPQATVESETNVNSENTTASVEDLESYFNKRLETELSARLTSEVARIEREYKKQSEEQYEEAKQIIRSRDEKWKAYVQEKLQWQESNLSRVWQNRLEQEILFVQERFATEASDRLEKEKGIEDRVQQLGRLLDQRISFAQDITRVHSLWVALFSLHHALHSHQATPFHHELNVMLEVAASGPSKEHDAVVDLAVESLRPLADGVLSLKSLQTEYKAVRDDLYRYAIHPDVPSAPALSDTAVEPAHDGYLKMYNLQLSYGSGGIFAHILSHVANFFLVHPSIDNVKLAVEDTLDSALHPHQRLQSAEYHLFHNNDLHAAVQEFEKLPRLAQERMKPWIVQARRRLLANQSYVLLQCHISTLAMGLL